MSKRKGYQRWRISRIGGARQQYVTTVQAPTETAAIKTAIKENSIEDPEARSVARGRVMSEPTIVPAQEPDRNDGKEWSAADMEDLALALRDGGSIEGAAYFYVAREPSKRFAPKP
jgi:hypothetical protein